MATQISKKRKPTVYEVLTRELAEDGYSGVEVRVTAMRTEIIIRATRTQNVLGEKGRSIRELTSLVKTVLRFRLRRLPTEVSVPFPDGVSQLQAPRCSCHLQGQWQFLYSCCVESICKIHRTKKELQRSNGYTQLESRVYATLMDMVHKSVNETVGLNQYQALTAEMTTTAIGSVNKKWEESKNATL